ARPAARRRAAPARAQAGALGRDPGGDRGAARPRGVAGAGGGGRCRKDGLVVTPAVDKNRALGKTAQRGMAWSFVRESVSEILLFPTSMLIARILTPEEFGVAAAALFFILLGSRLSELGFNAAIVRAKSIEPIHLSTIFVVQLALGVVAFAAMVVLAPWIGRFYSLPEPMKVVTVSALSFLIMPFGAVPSALLQRNFEYRKS